METRQLPAEIRQHHHEPKPGMYTVQNLMKNRLKADTHECVESRNLAVAVLHFCNWGGSRGGVGCGRGGTKSFNPLRPTVAIWVNPVPDWVKPSFVIFDIRALCRDKEYIFWPLCVLYKPAQYEVCHWSLQAHPEPCRL